MDNNITGSTIRRLREQRGMTQAELAQIIDVSSKTISKWETAKGLPDISLIEPLAHALGVSVTELMSGNTIENRNICANILRSKFYACPICGNIIRSIGDVLISCCGITIPALEADDPDDHHPITIETVEDEIFVSVRHPMTKTHFISFMAYLTSDRAQFVKLYPEGNAETRFNPRGGGYLYIYCNKHGLMRTKLFRKSRETSFEVK
jgi:transcriptional regulator with XRE-family HTH domain/desulfoferrodoxin (superoxide reductase-like protein)